MMKLHNISEKTLELDRLRKAQGHKFAHGHALVVSGGLGRSGAARMAARAALRVGAGVVTLAVPLEAVAEVSAQITAVMMRRAEDGDQLMEVLRDDRINALCAGPGLGISPLASSKLNKILAAGRPTVLDADALTLISQCPKLRAAVHGGCIMTPHGGEFARLFPDISEKLATDSQFSKAQAGAEAAARIGCAVLLKGAETVVAQPDGRVGIHRAEGERSTPWLATAGAGDVLSGFITGLLARGFLPVEAAEVSVFLHVECAKSFGPGLIAEDICEQVPTVLRRLLA